MTSDKKKKQEQRERKRRKRKTPHNNTNKKKKKKRGRKKRTKRHYVGEENSKQIFKKTITNTIEKKLSELCDYTNCEFVYIITSKNAQDIFSGFSKNLKLPFLFLNAGILLQELFDEKTCQDEFEKLKGLIDETISKSDDSLSS